MDLSTDYDQLKTRKDLVAEAIRTSILRGTFKPGEKLDQQLLADELGVSRSPVREALRTLGAEGLVRLVPNRGATVTNLPLPDLQELYFTRALIEGVAIERAVPHLEKKTLREMEAILQAAEETEDYGELLLLNNDFHMLGYRAYPQQFLNDYIQELRNMAAPYNRLYLDTEGSRRAAWDDHRRIYEACAGGDAKRARMEIQRHLDNVIDELSRSIRSAERDGHGAPEE